MERVAFLIEESGEQVGCLLNPESVVIRRLAGVRSRRSKVGGLISGGWSDDPLLYTGGGRTELHLDLLFDSSLVPALRTAEMGTEKEVQDVPQDIRKITASIWNLAENSKGTGNRGNPPLARFLWGKSWNILGIVTAVSERFERFSQGGIPHRAWLQIRFLRVPEPTGETEMPDQSYESLPPIGPDTVFSSEPPYLHDLMEKPGINTEVEGGGERLDELAYRFYGHASFWRQIALFNNVDNPADVQAGLTLQIPRLTQEESNQ